MKNDIFDERGLSLLEVIVSMLLLSIILISFFGFFVQSSKSYNTSETITNGIYKGQTVMEHIYFVSKNSPFSIDNLNSKDYSFEPLPLEEYNTLYNLTNSKNYQYLYIDESKENFQIVLKINKIGNYYSTYSVIIEIYDEQNKLKNKIENIYNWKV